MSCLINSFFNNSSCICWRICSFSVCRTLLLIALRFAFSCFLRCTARWRLNKGVEETVGIASFVIFTLDRTELLHLSFTVVHGHDCVTDGTGDVVDETLMELVFVSWHDTITWCSVEFVLNESALVEGLQLDEVGHEDDSLIDNTSNGLFVGIVGKNGVVALMTGWNVHVGELEIELEEECETIGTGVFLTVGDVFVNGDDVDDELECRIGWNNCIGAMLCVTVGDEHGLTCWIGVRIRILCFVDNFGERVLELDDFDDVDTVGDTCVDDSGERQGTVKCSGLVWCGLIWLFMFSSGISNEIEFVGLLLLFVQCFSTKVHIEPFRSFLL